MGSTIKQALTEQAFRAAVGRCLNPNGLRLFQKNNEILRLLRYWQVLPIVHLPASPAHFEGHNGWVQ